LGGHRRRQQPGQAQRRAAPEPRDLVGDDGASFDNRQAPTRQALRRHGPRLRSGTRPTTGHPLLNLDAPFPYRVELWAIDIAPGRENQITPQTKRTKLEFVQVPVVEGVGPNRKERKELVVPARQNQVFEIRVVNQSKEKVAMTLLMDWSQHAGAQKRERLGQARSWVLSPGGNLRHPGVVSGPGER